MMTVRFPNGQAVQYNDAINFQHYSDKYNYLLDNKGHWLALIPTECIIELVPPCRVYNPLTDNTNDKLEALSKEIRALRRKVERVKK